MSQPIRRCAVAVAAVAALCACNKLDKSVVEQSVMQSMSTKAHPMTSVTCPDGLEFKEQTLDCKGVDHGGKTLDFKVSIHPTSGGKADIRYVTMVDGKQFSN
jgi:hypothetical protein